MRRSLGFIVLLVTAASWAGRSAAQTTTPTSTRPAVARTRVGVFDSRAVALAYYNTAEYRKDVQQMMTELRDAKAANNESKIKELEFQGPALQSLAHYQVFSTASIPNVVQKLTDVLPKVAEEAGVSMIVSKWEVAFKSGDVEYVDVTDQLVRSFNPSDKVQQWIAQGKTQTPIPLLEAVRTLRPDQ